MKNERFNLAVSFILALMMLILGWLKYDLSRIETASLERDRQIFAMLQEENGRIQEQDIKLQRILDQHEIILRKEGLMR